MTGHRKKILLRSFIVGCILWIPAVRYANACRTTPGVGLEVILPLLFVGGALVVMEVVDCFKDFMK